MHPYKNTIVCKNDFFKNPDKVLSLFDSQSYNKSVAFPGVRTNNLLESTDPSTKNFALFFAQKICDEVFPGIHKLSIDVGFHINQVYTDQTVNHGWIHSDDSEGLAGVVYMSKDEKSLDTGTSIFTKKIMENFKVGDFESRQKFNVSGVPTDQYIEDLETNHNAFVENLRVGNIYNRLIAYDAILYHRPNRYNLDCKELRKSIVFFIRDIKHTATSSVKLNSNWEDS
jgi:hypothetical protein